MHRYFFTLVSRSVSNSRRGNRQQSQRNAGSVKDTSPLLAETMTSYELYDSFNAEPGHVPREIDAIGVAVPELTS